MLSLEKVKAYLKVEDDFDDNVLNDLILLSEEYMLDALNFDKRYWLDTSVAKRIEQIQLLVIQDLYDNRTNMGTDRMKRRLIVEHLIRPLQLKDFEGVELDGYGKTR